LKHLEITCSLSNESKLAEIACGGYPILARKLDQFGARRAARQGASGAGQEGLHHTATRFDAALTLVAGTSIFKKPARGLSDPQGLGD
jgi:hypothetical protein